MRVPSNGSATVLLQDGWCLAILIESQAVVEPSVAKRQCLSLVTHGALFEAGSVTLV